MSSSVLFWYFRISLSATVPGLNLGFSVEIGGKALSSTSHHIFHHDSKSFAFHILLVEAKPTSAGLPRLLRLGVNLSPAFSPRTPAALVGVPKEEDRGTGRFFVLAMEC
jgi:hypothetical protein